MKLNYIIKKVWTTKQKPCSGEVADFPDKKIAKVGSYHNCLAIISFNFTLMKDENYYPKLFSKECKYSEE